jgi:hypothetical protein
MCLIHPPLPELTLDVREQTLVLWIVTDETLQGTSDHGVLSHQYSRLSSEG